MFKTAKHTQIEKERDTTRIYAIACVGLVELALLVLC